MRTSIILDNTDLKTVKNKLKKYKDNQVVDILSSKIDDLEKLIYQSNLRIKALHFHKDIDLMLIVLNNKNVIQRTISEIPSLKKAKINQLQNYVLIGKGVGIHWPLLDEDISLKWILKQEINQRYGNNAISLVA